MWFGGLAEVDGGLRLRIDQHLYLRTIAQQDENDNGNQLKLETAKRQS